MIIVESERSFEQTWSALIDSISANPNITLVAKVDHGAAARSVGTELSPNRVAVFGNPTLGSPLMQENQVVGIDLPQKIQVFESRGRVWVGFNDASYWPHGTVSAHCRRWRPSPQRCGRWPAQLPMRRSTLGPADCGGFATIRVW